MTRLQFTTLLLAVSAAINLGCASGIVAIYAGAGTAQAVLTGGSTVGGAMMLFLAGVAVYRRPPASTDSA
ncbi:hypothetical protein [Streptomyces sp. NBC_00199]|uniref:hypothetical protein n=1 Tax=Streptomyces sp. NBC_00199 TaxID=2975678 RepID=UPI00225A5D20|nr:hypothetical protein [Streptomyces sp. NBC_00199]MCX5269977.1 hypothetical protein [Streptomyces sp. NBC_00199]